MRLYPLLAGVVFALMSITPFAFSQALQQQTTSESDADYSETELKSFATAAVQVVRIHETYGPRLQSAESPIEQQQIQQTASAAMTQAVEQQGLSIDRYNEILARVNADPAIADRVRTHLSELR